MFIILGPSYNWLLNILESLFLCSQNLSLKQNSLFSYGIYVLRKCLAYKKQPNTSKKSFNLRQMLVYYTFQKNELQIRD